MKLYIDAGRAPNPRRVRIFLAEKGVTIPTEAVDLGAMAHRSAAYSAINPMQRLPALVLDDGTVIAESIAISRYIEALHPAPPLFGEDAREQALVEMWQRRVEFHLLTCVSQVFRHLHPAMATMEVPQVAAWGEANKPRVQDFLTFLDGELKGRVRRGPALLDRRHHGRGRDRLHEAGQACCAGGAYQPSPLAWRGVGAAERGDAKIDRSAPAFGRISAAKPLQSVTVLW